MSAAPTVFDLTAATYDRDRAKLVPGHDRFYGWAVSLIPEPSAGPAARILDLGAGSGILTGFLRRRFPLAQVTLIDFSLPMLELARQRLSPPNAPDSNLAFQTGDYTTTPFPPALDAIVSALSIHHLDNTAKQFLFYKLHAALRPGGVFINADQVAGPTPEVEVRYKQLWLQQVRAAGATDQQIADSLFRQQADRCASVEDQLAWMRVAGFADADCWYKEARFAVLSGSRAA
jgi:tRNA (cmo5U34)-methyltransferase